MKVIPREAPILHNQVVQSRREVRLRWNEFSTLQALLAACERHPGLEQNLNQLINRSFPEAGGAAFVDQLRSDDTNNNNNICTLLATDRRMVVGVVQILGGARAFVANLCRASGKRYKGLGAELLRRARLIALDWGAHSVALRTHYKNRNLRRYYEEQGWRMCRALDDFRIIEYEMHLGSDSLIFE